MLQLLRGPSTSWLVELFYHNVSKIECRLRRLSLPPHTDLLKWVFPEVSFFWDTPMILVWFVLICTISWCFFIYIVWLMGVLFRLWVSSRGMLWNPTSIPCPIQELGHRLACFLARMWSLPRIHYQFLGSSKVFFFSCHKLFFSFTASDSFREETFIFINTYI